MSQRLVIAEIPVEIRRSARRRTRIGLTFDPRGHVIVDAPLSSRDSEIHAVITEHQRWMRNRLLKAREEAGLLHPLSYEDGSLVHYLGDTYRLEVRPARKGSVRQLLARNAQQSLFGSPAICGTLRANVGYGDCVKSLLRGWYSEQAEQVLEQRLKRYRRLPWLAGQMPDWRHSFMKTQWGSCSASGRISLNTHLTKVPLALVDYVVLHELCHLKHLNHGRRFYGLMTHHMPDWQQRRTELNRYVPVLYQDD